MKVNYCNKNFMEINEINVGETFTAKRTHSSDMGVYMKICKNPWFSKEWDSEYAVNLATGQLRKFNCTEKVQKIDAEVNIK